MTPTIVTIKTRQHACVGRGQMRALKVADALCVGQPHKRSPTLHVVSATPMQRSSCAFPHLFSPSFNGLNFPGKFQQPRKEKESEFREAAKRGNDGHEYNIKSRTQKDRHSPTLYYIHKETKRLKKIIIWEYIILKASHLFGCNDIENQLRFSA